MLATAGKSVKFWNLENYSFIQEVPYPNCDDISTLSWNKDGQFLLALNKNSSEIPLYAISSKSATCANILRVIDQPKDLQFANTTPRYLAIAGAKDAVLVWDIKNNTKKKSFQVPVRNGCLSHLSFNFSDSHLATGTTTGEIYLLSNTNNLVTGPIQLFKEKTQITDLKFSLNSHFLVGASGENGSVSIFDANSKTVLKEFSNIHSAPVSGLCFSPINELLMVTVGYDKKFISYNVNAKREIISHLSSAPLTSVCFAGNGQHIALGTMTGKIIIHDLRMLRNTLATISAYERMVSSMKLQPATKLMNVKSTKAGLKNTEKNKEEKFDRPAKNIETFHSITPMANATTSDNMHSGITPTLDLLSPVTSLQNNELMKQKFEHQRTPSKSFKKFTGFDDLGIISPIDKENQSPITGGTRNKPSNQKSGKRYFETKGSVIDDLLSPLNDPPNSRLPNTSFQWQRIGQRPDDLIDECLSPVEKELGPDPERDALTKHMEQLSTTETFSPSSFMDIQQLQNVKRDLWNKNKVQAFDENIIPEQNDNANVVTSDVSHCETESDETVRSSTLTTSLCRKVEDLQYQELKNVDVGISDFQPISLLAPLEGSNTGVPSMASTLERDDASLDDQRKKIKEKRIRFESLTECQEPLSDEAPVVSGATSNMNLELIQNCVADVLEGFEFDVNKRFMHVQFLMTKQHLKLQNEMRELFRQNSLNEEILLENERLREEIKRLKSTY